MSVVVLVCADGPCVGCKASVDTEDESSPGNLWNDEPKIDFMISHEEPVEGEPYYHSYTRDQPGTTDTGLTFKETVDYDPELHG